MWIPPSIQCSIIKHGKIRAERLKTFNESRISHGGAVGVFDHGLSGSGQTGDRQRHGNPVVLITLEIVTAFELIAGWIAGMVL